MLNTSLQTSINSGLSFAEELDFMGKHKIKNLDIFFDKSLPSDLSDTDIEKLLWHKDQGVQFTVHAPIENYTEDNAFYSEIIAFCQLVNAYSLTIHFDQLSENTVSYFVDNLGNTKLAIENTIPDKNQLTGKDYIASMAAFAKKFNIYATLDFGHAFVNGHEPLAYMKALEKNMVPISTFHCHNNEGSKDSHNKVQDGSIDFEILIQYIKQNYTTAVMIIERWEGDLESFNYLRNLILS